MNTNLNPEKKNYYSEKGRFRVSSSFEPAGDQIGAIENISQSLEKNVKWQTLLGVTGSGKTFVMAKIIEQVQRPALIVTHNKTLAAQLYTEFSEFFPSNMVGYFVSYYDYYQPEAYVAARDLYIEKDAGINEKIDDLRHLATFSLFDRRDVIIVASVSCIYGLGDPAGYASLRLTLKEGMEKDRDDLVMELIEILYERNDMDFAKRRIRVKGDRVDIFPPYLDLAVRVDFFGDQIEEISLFEPITGKVQERLETINIYPANHYATPDNVRKRAAQSIAQELNQRETFFKEQGRLVEAQRIRDRTLYDLEMIKEIGYCKGIENYSPHLDNRRPGQPPQTLIDYFPDDFILFVDESHVTLPQFKAMKRGDESRKDSLVSYGFRLPSAYDNRPLTFEEFLSRVNQTVFVSATPGDFELTQSKNQIHELITRPTGLLDPLITVKKTEGQIDDLLVELRRLTETGGRALVTTLTKRMAEELTDYLKEAGLPVEYLHSDIDTVDRVKVLNKLRSNAVCAIIGINLLREGLDLPEVTLVAILDADKQGFLRSARSLIQTCGRASRNVEGRVIMYADRISDAMQFCIDETQRRREKQEIYNRENNIIPRTIIKSSGDNLILKLADKEPEDFVSLQPSERDFLIREFTLQMQLAAENLDFELAAQLRDKIGELKNLKKVKI
jgi:excinuclease ABC subunit B